MKIINLKKYIKYRYTIVIFELDENTKMNKTHLWFQIPIETRTSSGRFSLLNCFYNKFVLLGFISSYQLGVLNIEASD